jgi:L-lactate dehydrogenase
LLLVANSVDGLTYLTQRFSGLSKKHVIRSRMFLDSARLRLSFRIKLRLQQASIEAYVLGEHGDSQFVAWSSASVGGRADQSPSPGIKDQLTMQSPKIPSRR